MTILYLTEDYLFSKVHNNLLSHLLSQDETLRIYVFSPLREGEPIPKEIEDSFQHNDRLIVVTPIIDIPLKTFRYNFWAKLNCKVRLIEENIPLNDIDVVHAAALYTEGGVALKLFKKYNIPYATSIRGTDSILYSKKMVHLWLMGLRIMKNAKAMFCITPSIKKVMLSKWQYFLERKRISQSKVVTNGIDDIWIKNVSTSIKPISDPIRVIYIGRFDSNKNVIRLINAIQRLSVNYNIGITLVGGGGAQHNGVLQIVDSNKSCMEYLGPIYDKQKLMMLVRECDIFAMVSHAETFGLVYIECLSQGLPLLYTKGTGIDGLFTDGQIGYGVDSRSDESIYEGLVEIVDNYDRLRNNIRNIDFSEFQWETISKTYLDSYAKIYNENCKYD